MKKKKVFISFDYDNDKILKDYMVGQSKNLDSPFEILDSSMKEAGPEWDWEKEARQRIRSSDIVLVILGYKTYMAPGVLKEVKIAREEGVPRIQIKGPRDGYVTPIHGAGRFYTWTWDNLERLLS
ncbi:TIR domain-containing protein [Chloroflexota bacterium]